MEHLLFKEIKAFDIWAEALSEIPQEQRGGEWECNYKGWNIIYEQFEDFLKTSTPSGWTNDVKDQLLYIIARDNEMQRLSTDISHSDLAVITLARYAIQNGSSHSKWQLAVILHCLRDRNLAIELLEEFINDHDEYVSRRALLELARLNSDKTEYYCKRAWDNNIHDEMDEYQRIAVLHSLKTVNSPMLSTYLNLAKQDGRKYLVLNAVQIENEIKIGN